VDSSQFFCNSCGNRLKQGARFCTSCGREVRIPAVANPALPVGGAILGGRWRIGHQIGKGGMGAVYLVHDTRLSDRRAALKEMLDQSLTLSARWEAIDRFNAEAETLARLSHPNIPHVYDRFTEGDRIYMVMEYLEGMDLERLLDKFQASYGAPLPEPVVVRHLYQIASALAHIHEQPLLHRELKPSNLILLPSGLVKVIDFGIAKLFRPGRQGTGLGTQGYAAPEQYRGEATPKTDLYALGATAHHLLSGRDPQLETPFDFPPLVGVSPGLAELVGALLAMRPEDRPANAAAVRQRLAELYPGLHDWQEDERVRQLLRQVPRPATRRLTSPVAEAAPVVPPPAQAMPVVSPAAPFVSPTAQATPFPPVAQPSPVAPAVPRFCTGCGRTLKEGLRFCVSCGKPVQPPASLAATPVPPAAAQVAPAVTPSALAATPMNPTPVNPVTPAARPIAPRLVPAELAETEPLELVQFDDTDVVYAMIGQVRVGQFNYAFFTTGPVIKAGGPSRPIARRAKGRRRSSSPSLPARRARSPSPGKRFCQPNHLSKERFP
jgi:serine/threonine protein kinase